MDIKNLTIEEKLRLLIGFNRWQTNDANGKVPSLFLSDGPNGLRMMNVDTGETYKATVMPNISHLANTWDEDLAFLDGETIANECIEYGADVLLAPGVNIKRTPLCGRNFEYFSEDPYLSGVMAKSYIDGVQSKGIGTSLKHFCANNREYDRRYVSSEVDERTMREIYLPAFEKALEAKPWTVMNSYNQLNGVWLAENKKLLKDVLRDEFGFDGLVVSDWSASHSAWRSIKNGTDLLMPYRENDYLELKDAYDKGLLTDEDIERAINRLFELINRCKTSDKKVVSYAKEERHNSALKIAKEGIVLLKNEDNILPLNAKNILVGGYHDAIGGGGSAQAITDYQSKSVCELVAEKLPNSNVSTCNGLLASRKLHEVYDLKDAVKQAVKNDVVVLSVSSYNETESLDRENAYLMREQEETILALAKYNPNVVVVVNAGSYIDMSRWINKVKAVVWAGFAGEASKEAVASVLTGETCPSGKLTETFPLAIEDTPTGYDIGDMFTNRYTEGIYVGYRWYEKYDIPVAFPFGHGLSYANFEYSNLKIEKIGETDYDVYVDVKNLSNIDAKEVVELYVKDVFSSVSRPEKELKGFKKVSLKAGETKTVKMSLYFRSFAFYSTMLDKWHIENGEFEILVGASSQDIRVKGVIDIELDEKEQYTLW